MSDDLTTDSGCTVRLRQPAQDFTKMLLMYDMGADDGRFAELMLSATEARELARNLLAFADRLDP